MADLHYEFALPTDPDLDGFESGVDEVDDYFQSRQWFKQAKGKSSPPTYQFRIAQGGEVVGYAAVAFGKQPHPGDDDTAKSKYLVIYVAGVHKRFHGKNNPNAPSETIATSMFRVLEEFATKSVGCVGLYLRVRADNDRAIGFYKKFGFCDDPKGPVQHDSGAPHLSMRKLVVPPNPQSSGGSTTSSSSSG